MKKIFFLLLLSAAAPAAALELSLEENKGESGTVGYVDIDRVFKEYSGTLNAREEFLGEIKKKEESVNQRRHEIYVIKADMAKLRQEREFALTLSSLLATQEKLNSSAPATASTQAAASISTPGSAPSDKTIASVTASTEATASAQAVSASSSAAVVAVSTAAAPKPFALSNLPGMENAAPDTKNIPADNFKFSVSTAVPEIDAAISAKENDLKQKESALKIYQRQVEKELLEYESHRSEILLGRIYITLKELAVREEVSVIIDKRNILFGHSAVDLTDKLLKKLEEPL
ncbi:MAG: hypothetical protein WCK75_08875 [Elusimicrobiota bacterium]